MENVVIHDHICENKRLCQLTIDNCFYCFQHWEYYCNILPFGCPIKVECLVSVQQLVHMKFSSLQKVYSETADTNKNRINKAWNSYTIDHDYNPSALTVASTSFVIWNQLIGDYTFWVSLWSTGQEYIAFFCWIYAVVLWRVSFFHIL